MNAINQAIGWAFDVVTAPLRGLPPLVGVAVLSLLAAVIVLFVFRLTSNPSKITAARRRIEAGLFEVRLFDEEPRLVLRALGGMLRGNAAYLRASFVPMLCTLVPLMLLMVQMQSLYGYRPVEPHGTFVVQARLAGAAEQAAPRASRPQAQLRVPEGLRIETPDVWIAPLAEIGWRVRAERAGSYRVELDLGGMTATKDVTVGHQARRLSPIRRQAGFFAQLLYPAEPALPRTGPLESIRIDYAANQIPLFAWRLPWIAVFLVLVTAFALVLKNRFRVAL